MSVVSSPPFVATCYSSPRTFTRQVNQLVVERSCFKRLPRCCSPWASVMGALSKPFTQSSKQAQRCWVTCPGHTARKRVLRSNPRLSDPGRCAQPVLSVDSIRGAGVGDVGPFRSLPTLRGFLLAPSLACALAPPLPRTLLGRGLCPLSVPMRSPLLALSNQDTNLNRGPRCGLGSVGLRGLGVSRAWTQREGRAVALGPGLACPPSVCVTAAGLALIAGDASQQV